MHSGVRTRSSGIQQRGLRRHVRECVPCHRLPVSPSSRHAGGHHRVSAVFYTRRAGAGAAGAGGAAVFLAELQKTEEINTMLFISDIHNINIKGGEINLKWPESLAECGLALFPRRIKTGTGVTIKQHFIFIYIRIDLSNRNRARADIKFVPSEFARQRVSAH